MRFSKEKIKKRKEIKKRKSKLFLGTVNSSNIYFSLDLE